MDAVPGRFGPIFVWPKRLRYVSVAMLFRFVAHFARIRIEDSSQNMCALNGIEGIARSNLLFLIEIIEMI